MTDAPPLPSRPWRGPLLGAAAVLWLPAAGAFVWSPLRECGHCVATYLGLLPVFPSFFVAHAFGGEPGFLFYAVGALASAALLLLVAALVRAAGRFRSLVLWPVALGMLAQGIVLGHLLRM